MSRANTKISNALGFLSVVRDTESSRIGGLLLINASGRPLEFHCTAPVKPNRAQEILYGPTLEEYLCGEQIGHVLHAEIKGTLDLLLTDVQEMLVLRHLIGQPLVLIRDGREASGESGKNGDDDLAQLVRLERDGITIATRFEYEQDLALASEMIDSLETALDLREPFTRIHEAIHEAQGGIRKQTAA